MLSTTNWKQQSDVGTKSTYMLLMFLLSCREPACPCNLTNNDARGPPTSQFVFRMVETLLFSQALERLEIPYSEIFKKMRQTAFIISNWPKPLQFSWNSYSMRKQGPIRPLPEDWVSSPLSDHETCFLAPPDKAGPTYSLPHPSVTQ